VRRCSWCWRRRQEQQLREQQLEGERAAPSRSARCRRSASRERLGLSLTLAATCTPPGSSPGVDSAARGAHEREDLRRADPLAGRVVGHRVTPAVGRRQVRLARRRVVGDAEAAAAVGLSVQEQPRPRRVALDQPGLVEEARTDRAGAVGDTGLHQRAHPAPPHGARGDRAHRYRHRRLLAGAQRRQRARLATVAGKVFEQVRDRVQPERTRARAHLPRQRQRREQAVGRGCGRARRAARRG
jgi:hypothetical protein